MRGQTIDDELAQQLTDALDAAAHEALAYAQSFDMPPVLVLEDLDYAERSLTECVTEHAEIDCWLLPTIQERVVETAHAQGVPVAVTSPEHTTQECHVCGKHSRLRKTEIRCTNERCPVKTVCRDRSAAVTIAKRLG